MRTNDEPLTTDQSLTTEDDAELMHAVIQHRYGSADTLAVTTTARPSVGPNDVLIEVVAAGLDRGVWHLMSGQPYLIRLLGYGLFAPKNPVPGMDVAGRVVEVGRSVRRFAPGDEVLGIATGSFAQFAIADADKLAHKPANVGFDAAAAATVSGITALQALTTVGGVEAGQRVLVIGASGGVGSFAVQLANAYGARVTGVASTPKLDLVRSLGADAVIDYTTTNLDDVDDRFDLILDIGGRNRLSTLRRILVPNGTLVIVGGEDGGRLTGGIGRQLRAVAMSAFVSQRLTFFVSSESREFIEKLVEHLANGDVISAIGRRVGLEEVPDAIREMETGGTVGKTVVTVAAPAADR